MVNALVVAMLLMGLNNTHILGGGVSMTARAHGGQVFNYSSKFVNSDEGIKSTKDSLNVKRVGYWSCTDARAVFVSGNMAFLGAGNKVYVLDVSDPTSPNKIGECDINGNINSIYVVDNQVYAAGDSGLTIIDVNNLQNPRVTGVFNRYSDATSLFVAGDYAYVVYDQGWLRIINISDSSNPYEVGSYYLSGFCEGIYLVNDTAYVTMNDMYVGNGELVIINVSDSTNPRVVGSCYVPDWGYGVYVMGDYAYVADWDGGLRIIDVSNPQNPYEAGFRFTPGWAVDVYVEGNYAYVADMDFRVIDLSDPTRPHDVGFYRPGYSFKDVYLSNGYIYAANSNGGLQILVFYGTGIDETSPNEGFNIRFLSPFSFDMEFTVPEGREVYFSLFDLTGRKVWNEVFSPGRYRIKKNLTDGVYFLQAQIKDKIINKKVMILCK